MKESFLFFRCFYEAIEELQEEDRLKCFDSICNYGLRGIVPNDLSGIKKTVFILEKSLLDSQMDKRDRSCREYKSFRREVLERDNYTCQRCGKIGKGLNVHHIKAFKSNPELRFDPDNGVTLCKECHREVHSGKK